MATQNKILQNCIQFAAPVARKFSWKNTNLRRFKKSEDGVAAMEFAITGPMFFMVFFAIIDLSIFYFMNRSAEAGAEMISRRIKTGSISSEIAPQALRQELCDISIMKIFDCNDIMIDVKTMSAFEAPEPPEKNEDGTLASTGFGVEIGPPASINVVNIYVRWSSIQDWVAPKSLVDGQSVIQVTTAFRKE